MIEHGWVRLIRHGRSTSPGRALDGEFRGERQRWFAMRFEGVDADIRLDLDPSPEFDAWRWANLCELPKLAPPFKRAIYQTLAVSFARFAVLAA